MKNKIQHAQANIFAYKLLMPDFHKVARKYRKVTKIADVYDVSVLAVNRYAALLGYKTTVNKKKFSFILEQQNLSTP